MKTIFTVAFLVLMYVILPILCIYGWVHNIVLIADANFAQLTGLLVLRIVGIFVAPLGIVMGFV